MKTYEAEKLDTVEVAGRNSGIFGKLRDDVMTMIPKGKGALIGDVVKELKDKNPEADYRHLYNYVRNACSKFLQKVNGRVFIVNSETQEPE